MEVWSGLIFQAFFLQRIVTASKSPVTCTVFVVLAFYSTTILQSLLLLSPHQMNYYIKKKKWTILNIEGSYLPEVGRAKEITKALLKYLGNMKGPIFSWANSPFHRCKRPCSCWWRGITETLQQENKAYQLKKPWLTLNQLKVFSIWFYQRG